MAVIKVKYEKILKKLISKKRNKIKRTYDLVYLKKFYDYGTPYRKWRYETEQWKNEFNFLIGLEPEAPYPFFINEYDEEVGKILLLNYEVPASKVRSILQNGDYFTQYYIAFYNKYYKRVDTKSVFFKEDHSIVLEYLELEKEEDNRLKEKEKLKIKAKKEREKLKAKKQKGKSKKNREEGNETK